MRLKLEGVIRQQIALHADFQAAQATVSSSAAADDDAARAARVRPPAGLRRRGGEGRQRVPSVRTAAYSSTSYLTSFAHTTLTHSPPQARKAEEAKERALGDDPPTPGRIGMAGVALTAAITAGTTPSGPAGASESERDCELRFRRRGEVCRRPNGGTAGAANGGTAGAVNGGTAGGTAGGTDPTPGATSLAPSVQPPPLASHFALQINPGRQPRARAPIDVDEVSVAVIASLQAAGVNIAAELVAVDDLGAGSVKVTVSQGAAGRSTSQLVAGASEETFLAALAEELDASVELGTVPTTAITASPSRPLPSTAATARASPPPFWAQPPRQPAPGV